MDYVTTLNICIYRLYINILYTCLQTIQQRPIYLSTNDKIVPEHVYVSTDYTTTPNISVYRV